MKAKPTAIVPWNADINLEFCFDKNNEYALEKVTKM